MNIIRDRDEQNAKKIGIRKRKNEQKSKKISKTEEFGQDKASAGVKHTQKRSIRLR